MSQPSPTNRHIAHSLARIFGGTPSARPYHDDKNVATVDMLTCADAPDEYLSSYATVGLSARPALSEQRQPLDFGVEIVGVCETDAERFVNVMSTCAFNFLKDGVPLVPGWVHQRAFELYDGLSDTLAHAMLIDPFSFEGLETMRLEDRTVAFVQMIGITDDEYAFLLDKGEDALTDLFEREQIDIYDIDRPSVVNLPWRN